MRVLLGDSVSCIPVPPIRCDGGLQYTNAVRAINRKKCASLGGVTRLLCSSPEGSSFQQVNPSF